MRAERALFQPRRGGRNTAAVLRVLRQAPATIVLVIAGLIVLIPLLWAVSTSLRIPNQAFNEPPQWIPIPPVWSNYTAVFQAIPFAQLFLNSVVVTGLIVVGQVVTATLAGYAFARLQFPGKAAIFAAILATLMVPLQATIIPVFVLIRLLHLADTLASLILPAASTAFGTFLMRQYFLQIPKEYEEAALVDGASHWQIFWRIYARLVTSGIAVVAILAFAAYWNEFFRPLIFLTTSSNFTLPLGLVALQGYLGTGSISVVLAGFVISLIPSLIVFAFGQRYLREGVAVGGLKG